MRSVWHVRVAQLATDDPDPALFCHVHFMSSSRSYMYHIHTCILIREDYTAWAEALFKYTRLTPAEWSKKLENRRVYTAGHTASKKLKVRQPID